MTRSEALELIRRSVSRIMTVDPKHAVFVNDEEVDYTSKGPIIVRRSALRPLAEERDWVPYLQGLSCMAARQRYRRNGGDTHNCSEGWPTHGKSSSSGGWPSYQRQWLRRTTGA